MMVAWIMPTPGSPSGSVNLYCCAANCPALRLPRVLASYGTVAEASVCPVVVFTIVTVSTHDAFVGPLPVFASVQLTVTWSLDFGALGTNLSELWGTTRSGNAPVRT